MRHGGVQMVLRTISGLSFLLLLTITCQSQEAARKVIPVAVDEALGSNNVPNQLVFRDKYLRQAYTDAFAMLSEENACSSFYGGPRVAPKVLNEFIKAVKPGPLPPDVSLEMAGHVRYIRNSGTGVLYRLFENAILNVDGSFYRHPIDHWQRLPHEIGSFPSGSRSARALILLHELAHLIPDSNGAWLIADDGHDGWQSKENTWRVQKVCLRTLRTLR